MRYDEKYDTTKSDCAKMLEMQQDFLTVGPIHHGGNAEFFFWHIGFVHRKPES